MPGGLRQQPSSLRGHFQRPTRYVATHPYSPSAFCLSRFTDGLGHAIHAAWPHNFLKVVEMNRSTKTKRVDGVDLSSKHFAYCGSDEDTNSWKLPIHILGDEGKTVNHIKSALARFDEIKGIPDSARRDVWFTIRGAALSHGLPVPAKDFPVILAEQRQAEEKAQQLPTPEDANALAAAIAEADVLADKMLRKLGLS